MPIAPPTITLLLFAVTVTAVATPVSQWTYRDQGLSLNLHARSPEQIAAFYSARKFPADMVQLLSEQCFITTRITNNSGDILWLDLDNWQFRNQHGDIHRHDRVWLTGQLDDIDAPTANRALLRWTLLPEQLDFKPDEQEGGNIMLPRSSAPFSVEAVFARGQQRNDTPIRVTIENLQCAESQQ